MKILSRLGGGWSSKIMILYGGVMKFYCESVKIKCLRLKIKCGQKGHSLNECKYFTLVAFIWKMLYRIFFSKYQSLANLLINWSRNICLMDRASDGRVAKIVLPMGGSRKIHDLLKKCSSPPHSVNNDNPPNSCPDVGVIIIYGCSFFCEPLLYQKGYAN